MWIYILVFDFLKWKEAMALSPYIGPSLVISDEN